MTLSSGRRALLGASLLLCPTLANAADPVPQVGPRPQWVQSVVIPAPDQARKDEPGQFLLLASQSRFGKDSLETFFEYAFVPQTVAGLQGAGTVALPWNISQTDMTIHTIELRRGNQAIDLLKNPDFTVLRRENNLEHAKLDGVRTVVLPAKGLQLGDVVHVAATYRVKPDSVRTHFDYHAQLKPPTKIGLFRIGVLVDPGVEVKWRSGQLVDKPTISTVPAGTRYVFEKLNAEAPKFPNAMRPVDKQLDLEFSRFQSWSEIANSFQPLFAAARKIEPDSALAKEADRIAAQTKDPLARMMAALRLAQEQVRYVALLLGEGAYLPTPAEENWERKFGDCKGKTALLLAILDRLEIPAEAMLVKSEDGSTLSTRLPALGVFDHVIVRATVAGKHYYLDATDYGQRTAQEVSGSTLEYGLPVVAGATLEKLPPVPVVTPTRESSVTWDASAGIDGEIPFTAKVTLRSVVAALARAKRATAEDKSKLEELLKNYLPGIANDKIQIADWTEADEAGDFVINYTGKSGLGWDQYEGMKGYRFSFSKDAVKWEPEFDRDEGPFKESDVVIGEAYWQKEAETVILPKGGKGFSVDGTTINEKLAGSELRRTVSLADGKAVSIGEFRHVAWSIPAEQARQAIKRLKEINEDYAFLVAPRGFRPAKPKD